MKIAYLILCHKNQNQINRLIDALSSEETDFYIHLDKKTSSFGEFLQKNVFVLPEELRVDIQWATFSMIQATLNLISYLKDKGKKYDYVFLLSGQDLPIKSKDYIEKFLNINNGKNFIEILDHKNELYLRYKKRHEIYYPQFTYGRSLKEKIARKLIIILTGGYKNTFSFFKRKSPVGVNFEYGSQWWGFTYECLMWIMRYFEQNTGVLEYFKNCMTPDESVFQTAFMSSPYCNERMDKVIFFEWNASKNNPRVFVEKDLNKLLSDKEHLFARKFDANIDPKVIEKLCDRVR